MDIIVHTSGRCHAALQHTFKSLQGTGLRTIAVVQPKDLFAFKALNLASEVYCLPASINNLSDTRDWTISSMQGHDSVVFLDDDLHFAVRRSDDRTKFRAPEPEDLVAMFSAVEAALLTHPMVGIGAREGGNRVTEPISYNTRLMRVLGFRRSYLTSRNMTFAPLLVMEDFHINLQILRSGSDTMQLNNWVSNQAGGSDAPGGCSVYRTAQVQTESAHLLAARHPGLVKVVRKMTKTAWGGKERTDVVVQWKKARKAGG